MRPLRLEELAETFKGPRWRLEGGALECLPFSRGLGKLLVPDLTLLMLCANLECPDKALDPAWTDPENSPRLGTNWIAEEAPCLPA